MTRDEHPLQNLIDAANKLAALIREAMRPLEEAFANFHQVIEDGKNRADHRDRSLTGMTPTRTDTRHVAHTNTRPPKPTTLYRRRTP